ncbi:MAG: AAA family ATPase [Candidatus Asgardarchaeia archaeon]
MSLDDLQKRAKELARKAVELDKLGKKEEAYTYYYKAAELLLKLAEITKIKRLRREYVEYANKYIQRCYEIRGIHPDEATTEESVIEKEEMQVSEEEREAYSIISDLVIKERPSVSWSDIADLEDAKNAIKEAIILPLKHPEWFKGARKPWKGILLFGPPGCGKTLIARAVASEIDATFLNVDAASIFVKWVGESEKRVKALFNYARKSSPSVIFIDEIDAMVSSREIEGSSGVEHRIKTQFLTEMDGVLKKENENVVVLAATNLPWVLDIAIRRRFEKRIYIPLPDFEARRRIFEIHLKNLDLAEDVDLNLLAKVTEFYTGSDIALICREAAMMPIRELGTSSFSENVVLRPIKMSDFEEALRKIKPSVSEKEVLKYEQWAKEYGSG